MLKEFWIRRNIQVCKVYFKQLEYYVCYNSEERYTLLSISSIQLVYHWVLNANHLYSSNAQDVFVRM